MNRAQRAPYAQCSMPRICRRSPAGRIALASRSPRGVHNGEGLDHRHRLSSASEAPPPTIKAMTRLRQRLSHLWANKGEAVGTVLELTVKGLELSKDAITAAAPVPGLGPALDIAIKLLKKVQVCANRYPCMFFRVDWEPISSQDSRSNCEDLRALCAEMEALAGTLETLSRTIEAGLDQYPVGSPERYRTKEEVFGSSKLLERVKRLERCGANIHCSHSMKMLI